MSAPDPERSFAVAHFTSSLTTIYTQVIVQLHKGCKVQEVASIIREYSMLVDSVRPRQTIGDVDNRPAVLPGQLRIAL